MSGRQSWHYTTVGSINNEPPVVELSTRHQRQKSVFPWPLCGRSRYFAVWDVVGCADEKFTV
jgi:hypothetical protein